MSVNYSSLSDEMLVALAIDVIETRMDTSAVDHEELAHIERFGSVTLNVDTARTALGRTWRARKARRITIEYLEAYRDNR